MLTVPSDVQEKGRKIVLGDDGVGSVHILRRMVRDREVRREGSGCSTCPKGHLLSPVSPLPERGCIQLSR